MGERFYTQQKNYKPKRILKKDVILTLERVLGSDVDGLDRLTIKTLESLTTAITVRISTVRS